jgi:hypothetical protein
VHSATGKTPFKGWFGWKPNVAYLKTFGSRVCVKCTGSQRCKLDLHDFTGIFLGYTATDQNITYLDTTTGIVKTCHHAVFDKAWYLQPMRPPAAQLLYDLGLKNDKTFISLNRPLLPTPKGTIELITVAWPPLLPGPLKLKQWSPTLASLFAPLPLQMTAKSNPVAAKAARTKVPCANLSNKALTSATMTKYLIGHHDMEMIYLSLDPYGRIFEEQLDLHKCDLDTHRTAGLCFIVKNGRLILTSMDKSTPGTCINKWHTHICKAWLVLVNKTSVSIFKMCKMHLPPSMPIS